MVTNIESMGGNARFYYHEPAISIQIDTGRGEIVSLEHGFSFDVNDISKEKGASIGYWASGYSEIKCQGDIASVESVGDRINVNLKPGGSVTLWKNSEGARINHEI